MTNNDILIRLRFALNLSDTQMVSIFQKGGTEMDLTKLQGILTKPEEFVISDKPHKPEEKIYQECTDEMFDRFLNGLIIYKRGPRNQSEDKTANHQPIAIEHPNNLFIKKIKIALSLKTEDMIEIYRLGGMNINKSELSTVFRAPTHRHYRKCLDSYIRKFLRGLTKKYRNI